MKYGDGKIPEKILKSIENKAAKASKSTATPITIARADATKEVAESTHDESELCVLLGMLASQRLPLLV